MLFVPIDIIKDNKVKYQNDSRIVAICFCCGFSSYKPCGDVLARLHGKEQKWSNVSYVVMVYSHLWHKMGPSEKHIQILEDCSVVLL